MGQATVIVTYKITPEGLEVDIEKLKKALQKFKPQKLEIEPIAFGLNAIKMVKVLPEIEGEADKLAAEIEKLPGVQTVDIIEMTRGL
ncbi:MAG: elongation factor 1-beta [Candidatus Aenigmarchaeota archaeon]|nr:elongation factor 1-beta [Candidatus Aenigmarchaeota archaeon]MBU5689229.1 elongation factor 1-beta [Candidatus Aenigmarchaeota archaeon]